MEKVGLCKLITKEECTTDRLLARKSAIAAEIMTWIRLLSFLLSIALFLGGSVEAQMESLWTRKLGSDWPRMLGTNFDSKSDETGILKVWPDSGLRVVWSANTGVGYGNGIAAKGRWFQFDRFSEKERLTCRNAETGVELWRWESQVEYRDPYGYNNGPRCSPVFDEDRVYVFGVAGTLACIAADDGSEIWKHDTNAMFKVVPNFFGVGASPLIYQDKLIVMIGGSPEASDVNGLPRAKPVGSSVVAFDKKTGKEIYRTGEYLASYSAPILTTLEGIDVCLALVREGLLAIHPKDGKKIAFQPFRAKILESVNAASPAMVGDKILISECYEIGCALLKLESNRFRPIYEDSKSKKGQLLRAHWSTPLVSGNRVIASSGRNEPDTDLRCLVIEAAAPEVKWTLRNRNRTTGLIVDGHAVLLGETGQLSLVDLKLDKHSAIANMDLTSVNDPLDGKPLVETPSWAPPVLSHGFLYVRGASKICCLELIPAGN